MPYVTRHCLQCGAGFIFYDCPSNAKRRGDFCTRQCWRTWAKVPLVQRFAKFIGEPTETGCLPWLGARLSSGYGKISIDGRQLELAHRVAWMLKHGNIPDGAHILHECDNPRCVNIEHLFLGSNKDNAQDKSNKGRAPRGETHIKHKLTETEVRSIRSEYATGKISQKSLGLRHGVSQTTILKIVRREDWAHVT